MPAPISIHQSIHLRLTLYEGAVQLIFQPSRDPINRPAEQESYIIHNINMKSHSAVLWLLWQLNCCRRNTNQELITFVIIIEEEISQNSRMLW
jgi:hypothetical protein